MAVGPQGSRARSRQHQTWDGSPETQQAALSLTSSCSLRRQPLFCLSLPSHFLMESMSGNPGVYASISTFKDLLRPKIILL